jgi:RNA polymerase sigma-70 factor (ECF subfamily)
MDASQEAELLGKAKAGNPEAFEALLVPHLPMLFAYSRAISGDHHRAQDVVQETAMIAFRNLTHLFPEVDFAAWLKAIARRQALAARRQSARLGTWTEEALEAAYTDPTPQALAPERDALSRCLETLDPRSSRLVRGHYFDGLRLMQLATDLDLNLNTVKTLLFRARLALKDCVQRRLRAEGLS